MQYKVYMEEDKVSNERDKTIYPTGIRDKEAYREYLKLTEHPLYSTDARVIHCSDEVTRIDLLAIISHIRMNIEHLPEEEQKQILAKASIVHGIRSKVSALKKKAFGMKQDGFYSMNESLLEARKPEILEMFGRMMSAEEVHKVVTRDWGYDINRASVNNFKLRYLDKVKELQLDYQTNVTEFRLGYTRGRIEELIWIYNNRKDIYERTKSKEDEKQLIAIMEQIRKETGADNTINVNHSGSITVNHVLQGAEATKMLLGQSTIMSLVLARVASKLKKNPAYLQYRLESSFYAKYTGLSGENVNIDEQEVIYPSQFVYDFDSIARIAKENKEKQAITEAEVIDITPPVEKVAVKAKKTLLEQLLDVKQDTNKKINESEKQSAKAKAERKPSKEEIDSKKIEAKGKKKK